MASPPGPSKISPPSGRTAVLLGSNASDVIHDKAAFKLYKLAAAQGHVQAQVDLGNRYEMGVGVIQDYNRAYMWWIIAAAQGNKLALKARDDLAKKMTPDQVAGAQKLARECVAKNYKGC